MGRIIEERGIGMAEVVEDIGGPEKISIDKLEIVSFVSEKTLSSLKQREFFDRDGGFLSAEMGGFMLMYNFPERSSRHRRENNPYEVSLDVQACAKEVHACFGLQHAECIERAEREIPKEWDFHRLLFPGTILRARLDGKLYIPVLVGSDCAWFLLYTPLYRQKWDLRRDRFVRWKR